MPLAGVMGGGLDTQTNADVLFVGGRKVNLDPGSTGNLLGTPIESIQVSEQGPGGVSSMQFDVLDPGATWTPTVGDDVRFWDLLLNIPRFTGRVDHWDTFVDAGGQGRRFSISATGIEAWLDWLILPTDFSINNGTDGAVWLALMLQGVPSPLYTVFPVVGTVSDVSCGIQNLGQGSTGATVVPANVTIAGGQTLRRAIEQLISSLSSTTGPMNVQVTVDMVGTVRAWPEFDTNGITLVQPSDYATLTVVDTYAGSPTAENLAYAREPDDVYREVYVKGFDAASSGLFTDGSGIRGRQGYISDTTINTAALALNSASNFLAGQSQSVSGNFTLSDYQPTVSSIAPIVGTGPNIPVFVRAGSRLTITDAATGATGTYRISAIEKTFNPSGRENWTVHFGGLPPSGTMLTRRLTRTVQN